MSVISKDEFDARWAAVSEKLRANKIKWERRLGSKGKIAPGTTYKLCCGEVVAQIVDLGPLSHWRLTAPEERSAGGQETCVELCMLYAAEAFVEACDPTIVFMEHVTGLELPEDVLYCLSETGETMLTILTGGTPGIEQIQSIVPGYSHTSPSYRLVHVAGEKCSPEFAERYAAARAALALRNVTP